MTEITQQDQNLCLYIALTLQHKLCLVWTQLYKDNSFWFE